MSNIIVRFGNAQDIPAIMDVMNTAFDPLFGERWTENQCLSALSMSNYQLIIALSDGIIVGFAMIRSIYDETELLMIGVHPDRQRLSIATLILRQIFTYCEKESHRQVFLEVRDGNPARYFYEKNGFHTIGYRRNYYSGADSSRFDAITMSKIFVG